jgi:branched-chain amino acid transport system substrate-binding protein
MGMGSNWLRRMVAAGLVFAGVAAAVHAETAPVRLGFSIAKTGIFAAAAPSQLNAYELWKDTVNARGGLKVGNEMRKIEFVVYDDQSNPAQAAKIYEKLINEDKVDLLLSPWGTSTHFAVIPVLERYKFPMVGSTATSVLVRNLKPGNIWFVGGPVFPDVIGTGLADLLKNKNVKSVSLLTAVLPMSKEVKQFLIPALQKSGIVVKVNEEYPPDIRDMTALVAKVKQSGSDAVISLSYPGDSPIYVRQAKELGIDSKFQFALIGPGMDFFTKSLGKAADGVVTIGFWSPAANERAKAFNDAYIKRFNEKPDYLDSVLTYMSCEVLEQAVAKAGLDRAGIREAIRTQTFQTINGATRFDGVQESTKTASFLQIQDGGLQVVWPQGKATSQWKPKTGW